MINSLPKINFNSSSLKTPSNQGNFVLPEKKEGFSSNNEAPKEKTKTNWTYLSGVLAAAGQAVAGVAMLGGSLLEKKGKISPELVKKLNSIGWSSMGLSYLVSMPSCIGASLIAQQPTMLLGMLIWGISSPLMMMKKFQNSARVISTTPLGAGFVYAGMANKVKNDTELKEGEKPHVFEFNKVNKNNLFSKTKEYFKFVANDLKSLPAVAHKTVSQSWDYITKKRKEPPEFWTAKPTENNSKLASILLLPGAALLMAFGKKYKPVEKAANILIGLGLLSEALYMYTLGNTKKGVDKALILTGMPLRAIGDFGQTNPIMLGMRTLGGASFEYYFATMNKDEEDKKLKAETKA